MAEPIGATIGSKLFAAVFAEFGKKLLLGATERLISLLSKSMSFEAHMKATFERCTKIRTLLNRDESVDLLAQYVNQKFRSADKVTDDYDVISQLSEQKRIVVSGSGGGGKTMFMKYLWIALFENPRGKIPIFVELRRLNDVTSEKLDSFIYHSIVESQSILSLQDFEKGIKEGQFIFLLDGFDEIVAERRSTLEKQVLELAHNNPELSIVISSRPDDRFNGWQSFKTFHVLPLELKQVVLLIERLKYDNTISKKFIERIRKDLYERHKSFLSNPLLATMMLLTFDQFADIPEKIHLFYEQAFDTLFAKHDATKEAYKRKTFTNLSIDVFKKYFSYFCLATYYDQKFEMSETEVLRYLDKGLKIEGSKVSSAEFLRDLVESVCTLQKDGLSFVFTHRSFQEFFAAYCLAHTTHKHLREILAKIARRPTDNVIKMLHDIRKELVESEFLMPELKEFNEAIAKLPSGDKFMAAYCKLVNAHIHIVLLGNEKESYRMSHDRTSNQGYLIEVARKLYPNEFDLLSKNNESYHRKDKRLFKENIKAKLAKNEVLSMHVRSDADGKLLIRDPKNATEDKRIPDEFSWLVKSGYAEYCRDEADCVIRLLSVIEHNQSNKDKAIDSLLGIG